ncbi:MAG: ribonuclease Z [Deltaproteobacteria bacterium]|nr:MAG: ribonuclease Z [Deltaproteobacteria bacterium]
MASAARLRRLGVARRPPAVPGAGRGRAGARVRLKLVPLGTSAGRPTLLRGASALAVATEGAWVLCDCGEGAQIAALRAGLSLSRLDAVLITHLHGDHFNGLPGLLGTLGLEGRQRPLVVAGPPGITALLQHLERAGSLGTGDMEVRVLEQQGNGGEVRIEGSQFLVESRPLAHRVPTYGFRVALPDRPGTLDVSRSDAAGVPRGPLLADLKAGRAVTLPDGRVVGPEGLVGPRQPGASMAYALDTVPCPSSVELGRGVDALVHEATYEDARAALAHERGHSTGVEAARIAAEAEAAALVLTHFSPSVNGDNLAEEAKSIHPRITVAEDLAEIAI